MQKKIVIPNYRRAKIPYGKTVMDKKAKQKSRSRIKSETRKEIKNNENH